jgi:hypothetical protein
MSKPFTTLVSRHEPDSHGRVLLNMLGITLVREMGRAEALAQVRALEKSSLLYGPGRRRDQPTAFTPDGKDSRDGGRDPDDRCRSAQAVQLL